MYKMQTKQINKTCYRNYSFLWYLALLASLSLVLSASGRLFSSNFDTFSLNNTIFNNLDVDPEGNIVVSGVTTDDIDGTKIPMIALFSENGDLRWSQKLCEKHEFYYDLIKFGGETH